MKDLLSDPLLYFATGVTLLIFGIAYVAAMVWSYNRDAKKQGKKSGCLPILFFMLLLANLASLLVSN